MGNGFWFHEAKKINKTIAYLPEDDARSLKLPVK